MNITNKLNNVDEEKYYLIYEYNE